MQIFTKILLLVLFLSLQACGGDKGDEEAPSLSELQAMAGGSTAGLSNAKKFIQTCRCEKCDLKKMVMKNFRPAEDKRFAPKTIGNSVVQTICKLNNSDLSGSDMTNINISAATSNYCTVPEEMGCDSYVVQTQALRANFDNADLSNSWLININFNYATFKKANLSNSEITRSFFAYADLTGANMRGIKAYPDEVLGLQSDFTSCNMREADLRDASLTGLFTYASFRKANLENAYVNSDESKSSGLLPWQKVNFIEANLKGAMIGIVKKDGKHVPGISDVVLKNARLCKTILPDGREENRDCGRAGIRPDNATSKS